LVSLLLEREYEPVVQEDLPASARNSPFDSSRVMIDSCQLFIGLVAWRYGFVPKRDNPDNRSFVELEHRYAWDRGKPTLVFLTAEDASWPRQFVDDGEPGRRQRQFRSDVLSRITVGFFDTPDDLATKVATAVAQWREESGRGDSSRRRGPQESPGSVIHPGAFLNPDPPALPDDVDLFELAWRLVVDRKADHSLLGHLDLDQLKQALETWARDGRGANETSLVSLSRAAQEQLRTRQSGLAPHPLWLAWIRTTRPSLGSPAPPEARHA
jgi:hypothetical protein